MSWEPSADPGERDRLVTIQELTETRDATSKAPREAWSTLFRAWMSKFETAGRERFRSDQTAAAFDTLWEMGYEPRMDPELVDVAKERQLVYEGRTYRVIHARQIGRKDGILLQTLASTRVA